MLCQTYNTLVSFITHNALLLCYENNYIGDVLKLMGIERKW